VRVTELWDRGIEALYERVNYYKFIQHRLPKPKLKLKLKLKLKPV